MSTTIGGIIEAGDAFHIYHGILLGQMKTFGTKKKTISQILTKHTSISVPYP